MRFGRKTISTLLFAAISLTSTACATKGVPLSPTIDLTKSDRLATPDPAKPAILNLRPATSPEAVAERSYLFAVVIKPVMDFSLLQEGAKQAEGQRADGVVAKIDAHNAVVTRKRRWRPFARDKP
jgi:hypothetical protein